MCFPPPCKIELRNPFKIIYDYFKKKKDPVPLERIIVIEDDIANGIKRTEYVLKTTDSETNNHNITFYENKLCDYAYEPYIDDDWDILTSPDVSGSE
jgi:hypothetical protein